MRLPVLLVATAGISFAFYGSAAPRRANFRVALLATVLFAGSCSLSMYNASAGSWLLAAYYVCRGIVFFGNAGGGTAPRYSRAAWSGHCAGFACWGLYTVPTFALVLGSAVSWLGLGCLAGGATGGHFARLAGGHELSGGQRRPAAVCAAAVRFRARPAFLRQWLRVGRSRYGVVLGGACRPISGKRKAHWRARCKVGRAAGAGRR